MATGGNVYIWSLAAGMVFVSLLLHGYVDAEYSFIPLSYSISRGNMYINIPDRGNESVKQDMKTSGELGDNCQGVIHSPEPLGYCVELWFSDQKKHLLHPQHHVCPTSDQDTSLIRTLLVCVLIRDRDLQLKNITLNWVPHLYPTATTLCSMLISLTLQYE